MSAFQYYSDDDQNNQNFDALFKRGEIYYALKQIELAIHDLELYCKTNPDKELYAKAGSFDHFWPISQPHQIDRQNPE